MMTCHECREDLPEFALGQADPARSAAIAEHVAACPMCSQELVEFQAAWTALPMALAPTAPRASSFDRVLERIDRQGSVTTTERNAPAKPRRLTHRERILSYVTAVTVLLGMSTAYYSLTRPNRDDAEARRSAERLAERLGNLQQLEQMLQSDKVRLASLHRPETTSAEQAFVLWDLAAGQWHFVAVDLPAAPKDRVYQLWAQQEGGEVHAGPTFQVNDKGVGSAVVDFPRLNPALPSKAIVTLEPEGGSKRPTGKVVLEAGL
jgi:anti-sigma-K factor RskA